jgi:hypothetical protein
MTVLLAHQGGWDELVLLAGPVVMVAVLIFMSRRRGDDQDESDD